MVLPQRRQVGRAAFAAAHKAPGMPMVVKGHNGIILNYTVASRALLCKQSEEVVLAVEFAIVIAVHCAREAVAAVGTVQAVGVVDAPKDRGAFVNHIA